MKARQQLKRWWWIAGGIVLLSTLILGSLLSAVQGVGLYWQSMPLPTLSPNAYTLRIADAQQNNRPIQALYHVEALGARYGWSSDLYQTAGDLWMQIDDPQRAVEYWRLAQTDEPNPVLLRSIAEVQIERQAWVPAVDTLTALVASGPDDTWANYHLGLILAPFDSLRAQRYLQQAAIDPRYSELARALRILLLENREADALSDQSIPMLVGLLLVEYEQWAYAAPAFEHANTVSIATSGRQQPEALAYLSLALDRQGMDGSAAIAEAVQLRPSDAQIRFLQGLHERHRENYQASLNAMIQAAALAPDNPALYAEIGTAYRLVDDLEAAEYWFQTAVAFSDDDPQFEEMLRLFYAEEAYYLGDSGLDALNERLLGSPDDPDLLASWGWAWHQLGDLDTALEQLDRSLEISPNNPRALYYKARILLDTDGDVALARELLTQVVNANDIFASEAERILVTMR